MSEIIFGCINNIHVQEVFNILSVGVGRTERSKIRTTILFSISKAIDTLWLLKVK